MLYYLDSVIVIFFLDHTGPLQIRASNRLALIGNAGDAIAVSDLVRMECRVGPLRTGDKLGLAKFDGFFSEPDLRTVSLSPAVFDLAASIRAQYRFKAPDSIHLAAAVESGCDRFLTHDTSLGQYTGITVEILP